MDIDLLVIATATESVSELAVSLKEADREIITAGDMVQPARIYEAIHSGFEAGQFV